MSSSLLPDDVAKTEREDSFRFAGVSLWGLGCSLLLLLAIVVAHPYAETGISDDFSYIWSAKVLAQTGHVAYNGGATAILGWQLYVAAAFIKLFGFSFSSTRASMMFVSVVMAFVCQRTYVRAGCSEWNASVGTILLVLSPLVLPLEVTFMSDVPGLCAVIVCLYACLRAVQAESEWGTIAWIGAASLSNVVLGSARQIAWLGALVMVPSVVWIFRRNRRVVIAGIGLWVVSVGLIFATVHWFEQQPYILYEPLSRGPVTPHVVKQICIELVRTGLEIVLLLLPVLVMYLSALRRKTYPWAVYAVGAGFVVYGLRMWQIHSLRAWFAPYLAGVMPFASLRAGRAVLTILVLVSVLAVLTAVIVRRELSSWRQEDAGLSNRMMAVLVVPFTIAYVGLLLPRAGFENVWDRYLLPLLFVAILFSLRFYQQHFRLRLPVAALVLAICFGAYAAAVQHDRFAQYRARVGAVNEVLAAGIPVTSVSGGWDFDGWTELQQAGHIFDPRMRVPAGVTLARATHYGVDRCPWFYCTMFPHVVPSYTISLCPRPFPGERFAPVPYKTWVTPPGSVYVVRFPDAEGSCHVP